MSYLQAYSKLLLDTRLLSKASSFLLAIFAIIEIGNFVNRFYKYGVGKEWIEANGWQFCCYLGFVSLIALIFAFRFVLLFQKSLKYVWATQILWLFGWLTISAYRLTTAKLLFGSFFVNRSDNCMDCMYSDTFVGASTGLFLALSAYLFFSPIKQFFVLFYSLASYFKNKKSRAAN